MAPLLLAMAACEDDENGAAATSGAAESAESPQVDQDSETQDASTDPEDHAGTLSAGLAGSYPIVCGYTFDATETQQMQALATSEVTPEATIYLDGSTVYWDIPEAGGKVAHILGRDGTTYSWKVPDDGTGVQGEDPADALTELASRLNANAHDCEAYTGSPSIFQVPSDIDFASF